MTQKYVRLTGKTTTPHRRRKRGDMPAHFARRKAADGNWRYRWEPDPKSRRAGWKGLDLKDPFGSFLSLGPAIELATLINTAWEDWRDGRAAVPPRWAHIAPEGVSTTGPVNALGAVWDRFMASTDTEDLRAKTRRDYANKFRSFCLSWGDTDLRTLDIADLVPEMDASGRIISHNIIADWHEAKCKAGAKHQANSTLAVLKLLINWHMRQCPGHLPFNPARLVKRKKTKGRIMPLPMDIYTAMRDTAHSIDLPEVADFMELTLDLFWRPADILSLQWSDFSEDGFVYAHIAKPDERRMTAYTDLARQTLARIRARRAAQGRISPWVIVASTTGRPFATLEGDTPGATEQDVRNFRERWKKVQAALADTFPEAKQFTPQDMRDTAMTLSNEAGLSTWQRMARSQHSDPASADAMQAKHYGKISREIHHQSAAKMQAFFEARGLLR
jgi:hypothetical protein